MTVAPGERSLSVTAVVWALMTATGQIPIAALVTKLLPFVIWGNEDQRLCSHRSRSCVRVRDRKGKSGNDKRP